MKHFLLLLLGCMPLTFFSQNDTDSLQINPRYFEDQFYVGVNYSFTLGLPDEASQRNFSYGLQLGFIKDIPINRSRTMGFGVGLGLATYNYYTNIRALENEGVIEYQITDDPNFRRSKIENQVLELPLEFRWRNSDATTYSFWRIYTGLKLEYVFNSRSKFVLRDLKESFKNTDVRSLQYGLTFNVGYHNFNVHAYYSLSGLFEDEVTLDGTSFQITPLRVGLIFYIL